MCTGTLQQRECHCTEGQDKSAFRLIKHRTVDSKWDGGGAPRIPTRDGGERLMYIL